MSDQQKISEFGGLTEEVSQMDESEHQPDSFGWGSFGKPPDDWPVSRVEDMFNIEKDSIDPDELEESKLVRLYSMPAFDEGKEPETIKAGDIGSKKFRVPSHTLLFSKLNISKKRFWLVHHNHEKPALCSTEYWPLLPEEGLNLEFYLQYFNSDSFIHRPRLSTSSTTNSHQRIKSNLFNKVRLPVPPLEEQRKIASVLYTVDQAIQKTEELITQLEQLKQGVAQELFRYGAFSHGDYQETIIGQVPQSWKLTKLGDLIDLKNGLNFSSDQKGSGTLLANVPNVYGSIEIDPSELDRVDISESDIENYKLRKGDIITVRSSKDADGVGQVAIYRGSEEPVVFAGFTIRQRPNTEIIIPEYLIQYLRYPETRKRVVALGREVALTNVSQGDLEKIDIPVPPQNEQQEIIDILSDFDQNISKEQQYIDRLTRLKQGLMQDLLSGEVRTHDKDIELVDDVLKHG